MPSLHNFRELQEKLGMNKDKTMKKAIKKAFQLRNIKDYTSILATDSHEPITSIQQLPKSRWSSYRMGLFYKGVNIGGGSLERVERKPKAVGTDGTGIDRKYRNQGHGLMLYISLINKAKEIGATRIYSSTSLNKFSRRMWREKLAKYYKVQPTYRCKECDWCNSKHRCVNRFYIDL